MTGEPGSVRRHEHEAALRCKLRQPPGLPANANTIPLPAQDQFFNALVAWVENGTPPGSLALNSADNSVSMRVCPHPQKATYTGAGSITVAASYICR